MNSKKVEMCGGIGVFRGGIVGMGQVLALSCYNVSLLFKSFTASKDDFSN